MHGKEIDDKEKREAICNALDYAEQMNNLIGTKKDLGFKPFSANLRGFTGRRKALDKKTTRLILKGMGFTLS